LINGGDYVDPITYREVKHDMLTPDLEVLRVEPIADLHIGTHAFCELAFKAKLRQIQASPNTLVVLDGDLINNSIKSSVGNVYEEKLTPDEQVDYAIEILEPIKDRIIAVTRGNHEWRSIKDVCLDPVKYICRGLGIEKNYFRDACFLVIPFGQKANRKRVVYSIYMAHGNGGGSTSGGKVNGLSKMGRVAFSDIVIGAHTHMQSTHPEAIWIPDLHNKRLAKHTTWYVNTGTYLDSEGYAVRKGMPPSVIGNPGIILDGKVKRVQVTSS
jgi:hypothetical protein